MPEDKEQDLRRHDDEEDEEALERLFAGENLRLFAMFLLGMSVGILLTLLYVDVLSK